MAMNGLSMMLKAFGIPDEDIKKIAAFIPQVPTVAQNAIRVLNEAVSQFDSRLRALETSQAALMVEVQKLAVLHDEIMEVLNGIRSGQLRQPDDAGSTAIGPASNGGADSHSLSATTGKRTGRRN